MRLTLVPSVSWVQCGSFLDLCYSARSIVVKVDPTGLAAGVHSARIRAYESNDIEKGTIFEVPITVVQPITINESSNWRISFGTAACKPNTILRHFIQVPSNATWAGQYTVYTRGGDFHVDLQLTFNICSFFFVLGAFPVLRLRSNDTVRTTQAKFLIHTMQVLPQRFCKTLETQKILPVSIENDTLHYFKVEVCETMTLSHWPMATE